MSSEPNRADGSSMKKLKSLQSAGDKNEGLHAFGTSECVVLLPLPPPPPPPPTPPPPTPPPPPLLFLFSSSSSSSSSSISITLTSPNQAITNISSLSTSTTYACSVSSANGAKYYTRHTATQGKPPSLSKNLLHNSGTKDIDFLGIGSQFDDK